MKDVAGWKPFVLLAAIYCGSSFRCPASSGQEKLSEDFVKLPELCAYKLPKDEFLIFNGRFGRENAESIRNLRKVPVVHPEGTPTSLLFDKYLHRKSLAIDTESCYVESDWLTQEELAVVAAVARQSSVFTRDLVKNETKGTVKLVIAKKQDDYYSLVDAWADTEKVKRQARSSGSAIIGEYRCGYRSDFLQVLTLASADAVSANLDPYLWNQPALSEGLHTYISSLLLLSYEHYISLDATTPTVRRETKVKQLLETARECMSRPKRESLEVILRSDLNSLNSERLSIAFALVHYILETKRGQWGAFLSSLQKESTENGLLKGPEGLWNALSKAISEGFGLSIVDLDKSLQEFVTKRYLYTEEIASLIGVDRECADTSFQGFVKICELKRLKKPVSEKGEKLYQEILGKIDKKLQSASEKF